MYTLLSVKYFMQEYVISGNGRKTPLRPAIAPSIHDICNSTAHHSNTVKFRSVIANNVATYVYNVMFMVAMKFTCNSNAFPLYLHCIVLHVWTKIVQIHRLRIMDCLHIFL